MNNFWKDLRTKGPILGLSPMDGVTDAPTRKLIAQTSSPDVIMTEFVNVEGMARGAVKMLDDFVYSEVERPIVAQIYGTEEDSFYKVALIACFLGFDGIDINMGCPAKKVAHRGAGAGLIQTPEHAKKIVRYVQKAIKDFANGKTLEDAEVRPKMISAVEKMIEQYPYMKAKKQQIPVSIKTRMGYDDIVAEHWMEHLLETNPEAITLHGRTLVQKYTGEANWNVIAKASEVIRKNRPETIFLGNGDIIDKTDALEKIQKAQTDGALIGRATWGNPWLFSDNTNITPQDRLDISIQHCQMFEEIFPSRQFFIMRKHLGWYMKGFDGAKHYRRELMKANTTQDVRNIFSDNTLEDLQREPFTVI